MFGEIYETNFYGKVEVVAWDGDKLVIVRFVDTNNLEMVSKSQLLRGAIRDNDLEEQRKLELKIKVEEEKAILAEKEKEEKRLKKEALKLEKQRIAKDIAKEKRQIKAKLKLATKLERAKNVMKLTYTDKLGMEYSVVSYDEKLDSFTIKYLESGNEYLAKDSCITYSQSGIRDFKHENYEDILAADLRQKSATKYMENRDQILARTKEWQNRNPEKVSHLNRLSRARYKNAEGAHTIQETKDIFTSQNGLCSCCNLPLNHIFGKHLDHIMPLALGGTNYASNLQWLCQFCNTSKNKKHPDEWETYSKTNEFKIKWRQMVDRKSKEL